MYDYVCNLNNTKFKNVFNNSIKVLEKCLVSTFNLWHLLKADTAAMNATKTIATFMLER